MPGVTADELPIKLIDNADTPRRMSDARWTPLALGLFAVVLCWDFFWLPQILNFSPFAFGDPGANLTLTYLVTHGYRPVIDFGYLYGLLALLANLAWFRVFPLTPTGYQVFSILCQLGVVCALARTARILALRPLQLIFLFLAIGRVVPATYWNFSHGLEAVLICFALSEQARGARANALGLTTAAVFAKPSMGFVYSAWLLTLIALDLYRRRQFAPGPWLRQIRPAVIVGTSLCVLLGLTFGVYVLWQTVLPINGVASYRAQNMGFFTGTGSQFWRSGGLNWHHYAGTMIGLWIVATVYLFWRSLPAGRALWHDLGTKPDSVVARRDEVVFSCALLHLAFIVLFFGNPGTWGHYSYLLIAGVAAISIERPLYRCALGAIIVVAAVTYYGLVVDSISAWRNSSRSPVTANLWSSKQEQDEWSKVLDAAKGRRAVVLHYAGAVELLYPEFERPVGTYFLVSLMPPVETQREAARIDSAQVVIMPEAPLPPGWGGFATTAETEAALAHLKRTGQGVYFSIYERK